jgi:hypothetical protein
VVLLFEISVHGVSGSLVQSRLLKLIVSCGFQQSLFFDDLSELSHVLVEQLLILAGVVRWPLILVLENFLVPLCIVFERLSVASLSIFNWPENTTFYHCIQFRRKLLHIEVLIVVFVVRCAIDIHRFCLETLHRDVVEGLLEELVANLVRSHPT